MSRLEAKVIVTTGGTQGIGEAIALQSAREGAAGVVLCGRQEDKGHAGAASVEQLGCAAEYVHADLSIVEDCRNVVRRCDERFGRVDGLVNSAADTNRSTLDDLSPEFWDYQFAVNVRAPFLLTQECVRVMKREKTAGSIVNILSAGKYCGVPSLVAYSSTKGALSTFTKNVANGLRVDRIRVNGINLGWTDTPGEHAIQGKVGSPGNWLETAEKQSPFGRLLKTDDVARLCMYLLSDESGILTGSNIDYTQHVVDYSSSSSPPSGLV